MIFLKAGRYHWKIQQVLRKTRIGQVQLLKNKPASCAVYVFLPVALWGWNVLKNSGFVLIYKKSSIYNSSEITF